MCVAATGSRIQSSRPETASATGERPLPRTHAAAFGRQEPQAWRRRVPGCRAVGARGRPVQPGVRRQRHGEGHEQGASRDCPLLVEPGEADGRQEQGTQPDEPAAVRGALGRRRSRRVESKRRQRHPRQAGKPWVGRRRTRTGAPGSRPTTSSHPRGTRTAVATIPPSSSATSARRACARPAPAGAPRRRRGPRTGRPAARTAPEPPGRAPIAPRRPRGRAGYLPPRRWQGVREPAPSLASRASGSPPARRGRSTWRQSPRASALQLQAAQHPQAGKEGRRDLAGPAAPSSRGPGVPARPRAAARALRPRAPKPASRARRPPTHGFHTARPTRSRSSKLRRGPISVAARTCSWAGRGTVPTAHRQGACPRRLASGATTRCMASAG